MVAMVRFLECLAMIGIVVEALMLLLALIKLPVF
jgi:hypothetical protein